MNAIIVEQNKPDDYVIATGETHTVREFVNLAFSVAALPLSWEGEGLEEKAYNLDNWFIDKEFQVLDQKNDIEAYYFIERFYNTFGYPGDRIPYFDKNKRFEAGS